MCAPAIHIALVQFPSHAMPRGALNAAGRKPCRLLEQQLAPPFSPEMGTTMHCRGEIQSGHLPPQCSVRIANMRSAEPRMALQWMSGGMVGTERCNQKQW